MSNVLTALKTENIQITQKVYFYIFVNISKSSVIENFINTKFEENQSQKKVYHFF